MRDPKRIPGILRRLQAVWEQNPDLRLGQLIWTATPPELCGDPFYAEDELLIQRLELSMVDEKNKDGS